MKNFYKIRVLNIVTGRISLHIVKAETESEALEMVPGGCEILDIQAKGLVQQ